MRDDIDLYLIRHAQSEANVDQSINRHKADHAIELTDLGREQATIAGLELASILLRKNSAENAANLRNVQMWVSPYSRTRETAKIIANKLWGKGISIQVNEEPVLIEQQYGIFDGYPDEALKKVFPREWEDYNKWCSQQGKFYARMPNGESKFDVYIRIYQFLDALHRRNDQIKGDGRKINIVVSHGVTLRMLKARWLRMSVEEADKLKNPWNCSIESISSERGIVFEGFKAEPPAEPPAEPSEVAEPRRFAP